MWGEKYPAGCLNLLLFGGGGGNVPPKALKKKKNTACNSHPSPRFTLSENSHSSAHRLSFLHTV